MKCRACHREAISERTRCETCFYKAEARRILRVYDLTSEAYIDMMFDQYGRCAVCREYFTRKPSIDHDPKSRKIRGLLCIRCNTGLHFIENSIWKRQANIYLRSKHV